PSFRPSTIQPAVELAERLSEALVATFFGDFFQKIETMKPDFIQPIAPSPEIQNYTSHVSHQQSTAQPTHRHHNTGLLSH
ncbi:MAG: hypothetical protein AAGC99_21745, partial [Pseudomonadota bacterium]